MPKPKSTDAADTSKKKPIGKPMVDIAKPGKSSPDTGSRPIIVSRRPVVDDPMVRGSGNESANASGGDIKSKPLKDLLKAGRKELIINPTDDAELKEDTTQPQPGETISAGGDEAAADEKTIEEPIDSVEDLPIDTKAASKKPVAKTPVKPDAETETETIEPLVPDAESTPAEDSANETETNNPEEDNLEADDEKSESEYIDEIAADDSSAEQETQKNPEEPVTETPPKPAKEKPTKKTPKSSSAPKTGGAQKEASAKDADKEEPTHDGVVQEPEGGLVDELAKQTVDKKKQVEQDKQMAAKQEKIEELTAAKTYYVKTSKLSKRRTRNILIVLVLVVVLALVGLNFAADAELLDVGVKPLTNIL